MGQNSLKSELSFLNDKYNYYLRQKTELENMIKGRHIQYKGMDKLQIEQLLLINAEMIDVDEQRTELINHSKQKYGR